MDATRRAAGREVPCRDIDLPGLGIHPDPEFRMERTVADINSMLESVDTAVLVGHSLGGYVAIHAAAPYPEQFDGVLPAGAAYTWN